MSDGKKVYFQDKNLIDAVTGRLLAVLPRSYNNLTNNSLKFFEKRGMNIFTLSNILFVSVCQAIPEDLKVLLFSY